MARRTPIQNYLTFDIEEWYHANFKEVSLTAKELRPPTNLDELVDRLLQVCDQYQVKATFFVVGSMAAKKPSIVKQIVKAGHEVASHSFSHQLVYQLGPKRFANDLEKSIKTLEDIAGRKVYGFRAPSWSVTEETLPWYYETLLQQGLTYSSSVFPVKTFLYGIPNAPRFPHIVNTATRPILEIPCSTAEIFNKKIGFSGGFYMRALPLPIIKKCTDDLNQQHQPTVFYLHPREIDPDQPKLALPPVTKYLHYYGINSCQSKLEKLLSLYAKTLTHTLKEIKLPTTTR